MSTLARPLTAADPRRGPALYPALPRQDRGGEAGRRRDRRRARPGARPGRAAAAQRRRALRPRPWRRAAGRRDDARGRQGAGISRRPARHRRRDAARSSAWCWSARSTATWSRRSTAKRSTIRSRSASPGEDGGLLVATPARSRAGLRRRRHPGPRRACSHGLLDEGLAPVVSTVGADASGQPYNINADEAARAIAVAMEAEKIVYLTAAPGLLEDAEGREPA